MLFHVSFWQGDLVAEQISQNVAVIVFLYIIVQSLTQQAALLTELLNHGQVSMTYAMPRRLMCSGDGSSIGMLPLQYLSIMVASSSFKTCTVPRAWLSLTPKPDQDETC